MPDNQKKSIPFKKKRWPRVVAVIALLVAGLLMALPHVVRFSAQRWLENNGAQSAEINKVRLNLFAGTASINGLQVKLDNDVVLGDADLNLNIRLISLFKKVAHLETGVLSGLILDVELGEDGSLRIGSISIPASSDETTPEEPAEPADVSWFFRATNVQLTDCLIRFKMPGLEHNIYVKKAVLQNLFSGVSSEPAHLELEGTINDTPISLTLDRIEISSKSDRVTSGHIKIDGYKLDNLQELLKDALDSFTGSVALDGKIQASIDGDGTLAAQYTGALNVDDANIGNSDFSVTGPSVSYNGTIGYEQDKDLNMVIDVDGMLEGTETALKVPVADLDMLEKQLQIKGKTRVSISKEIDVTVATDADLTLGEFTLDLPPMNISNSSLDWLGRVEYKLPGGAGSQTVSVKGEASLHLPAFALEDTDFSMHTQAEEISWQGQVDLDLGADKAPMTILTDGLMSANGHQLTITDLLELREKTLAVDGITEISIGDDIKISHDGRKLQLADTSVSIAGTTSSGSLSWQGRAGYLLAGDASTVSLDGTLKGTALESLLEEQKITINQQDLSLITREVSLKIGEQIKLDGKASLEAGKLVVKDNGFPLAQLEKTVVAGLSGTATGGVQVEAVTFSSLETPATETQPLTVAVPEITFKNITSTDFTGVTVDELLLKTPAVHDTQNDILLVQIDSIAGRNIKADASAKLSLDSLTAAKGVFLKKEGKKHKPLATLAKMDVNKVSWSASDGLLVDTIALDSLFARYDKVKGTSTSKKTTKPAKKKEKKKGKETTEPAETATVPLQINSITLTGSSALRFTDHTLTTPFLATLALQTVEVKDINSGKPDSPMSFALKGKIDKYAPLEISGTATPFAGDLAVDAKIQLRNYSMQLLSAYVTDAIGTKFTKGQLNLTSDLKIEKDHLDLENHLVFQGLEAETVREELLEKLNNELPVPLDLALTMLRDHNGDIDLSIPITGPLAHISVNPTDIIVTALSKAIGIAVTPYLAYTFLGPAGALAYAGMKAGEMMLDTSFPTLEYENGATELTDAHKEILKNIGKAMEKNKDRDHSICSRVLLWELSGDIERNFDNQQKILQDEEARKKLLVIGGARAENVQQYLLQEFAINKEHLLICAPNINFEPDGKPMVGFR